MSLTQTQFIQGPATSGGVPLTLSGSDIGAATITKSNINMYGGNGKTGTGSPQSIAHGLGAIPSFVTITFTGTTAAQAVTYGTHTNTNIVLTVTSAATFDVIAFA
jgi:hypothetical protein